MHAGKSACGLCTRDTEDIRMQHTFVGKGYKWYGQHHITETEGTFTMIFENLHTPGPSDSHHIYRLVRVNYPEFIKHGKHRSTCDPQPRSTLNQSELLSIFLNRSFHLLLLLVISRRKSLVYWIWRLITIPLPIVLEFAWKHCNLLQDWSPCWPNPSFGECNRCPFPAHCPCKVALPEIGKILRVLLSGYCKEWILC